MLCQPKTGQRIEPQELLVSQTHNTEGNRNKNGKYLSCFWAWVWVFSDTGNGKHRMDGKLAFVASGVAGVWGINRGEHLTFQLLFFLEAMLQLKSSGHIMFCACLCCGWVCSRFFPKIAAVWWPSKVFIRYFPNSSVHPIFQEKIKGLGQISPAVSRRYFCGMRPKGIHTFGVASTFFLCMCCMSVAFLNYLGDDCDCTEKMHFFLESQVWYRKGTYRNADRNGNSWHQVEGQMQTIEVCDDIVFGVNKQGKVFARMG